MKCKQFLAVSMVLLLLLGMLAGCEAKSAADSYNKAEMGMDMAATYAPADTVPATTSASLNTSSNSPQESAAPVNQKLIRTVRLEAETEDMDALLDSVYQRVTELGGYVENRNIYNGSSYYGSNRRSGDLTIRIPADRLDSFVQHVSDVSNITSNRETTEDVTLQYVATESRIIALETEQTRLLELLAKAEDMGDLLMIESRLTEVRAELEQVKSQLRLFDNLVSYGTIHLSISEVREYTVVEEEPETVWERISTGFVKSLKGLWKGVTEIFVFLVVALPYLLVFGLLITGVVLLVRLRRKKKFQRPIQTDFEKDES